MFLRDSYIISKAATYFQYLRVPVAYHKGYKSAYSFTNFRDKSIIFNRKPIQVSQNITTFWLTVQSSCHLLLLIFVGHDDMSSLGQMSMPLSLSPFAILTLQEVQFCTSSIVLIACNFFSCIKFFVPFKDDGFGCLDLEL